LRLHVDDRINSFGAARANPTAFRIAPAGIGTRRNTIV